MIFRSVFAVTPCIGAAAFGLLCCNPKPGAEVPEKYATLQIMAHPENPGIDSLTGLPVRVIHARSGIPMVLIPAGTFAMGDDGGDSRQRKHQRVIRHAFYLAETETTVAQFRTFIEQTGYVTDAERGIREEESLPPIGAFAQKREMHRRMWDTTANWRNPFPLFPEYALADDHPVCQVSWNDAKAFCRHYGLSLPTEVQWEYAARAGSNETLPWGSYPEAFTGHDNQADASTRRLLTGEGSFFAFDDGHPLHAPVYDARPNAFGVYGTAGGVEEWCSHDFNVPLPKDGDDENMPDPVPGQSRLLRGGNWFSGPGGPGYAERFGMLAHMRRDFIGFRVSMKIEY